MKNPFLNALAAGAYIVAIVSLMSTITDRTPGPDTILIPMAMLSLFTLSAAVMGYLFIAQPFKLYLDGQKEEAVSFFLKTLASFAVITGLFMVALLTLTPLLQ